jgi:hypothetical protein
VTITFSEAVTGFTNADLTVANGTLSAVSSSDGGITWTATFTPTSNITDATNLITLDNTGVQPAGNAGSGTTDSNNYAIDTQRPTATIVVADTRWASADLAGDHHLQRSGDRFHQRRPDDRQRHPERGEQQRRRHHLDRDLHAGGGITDTSNLITLDNTGVADPGNAGSGTTDSNNYAIDSQRRRRPSWWPTACAGETSLVTITFSEAVTGFTMPT